MDELAKHIERSLKERAFCLVFEEELERCWPSEIKRADREKQIQTFAKSRGWIVSILNTDSGMRQYSSIIAEDPHCISQVSAAGHHLYSDVHEKAFA